MLSYFWHAVPYITKTFGTWQKPCGNRGWRLIEGKLIEGILYMKKRREKLPHE